MNDLELEGATHEAAQHIEKDTEQRTGKTEAEQEEEDFLDPSRWWFASTACPLIAGTFGPIASAFSICALVEKWRVFIPPGADEGHAIKVEDPKWLIAINTISLIFALIANMSLLLNMAQRLSFAIAQPITIIGWFFSSILLIILVALASTSIFRIQPAQEHALSQAFYYGIMAAGLYFIIASLMVVTVVGAYRGHYPKEFRLTPSQRTLMLQTIAFVTYLLIGALIFSTVEGWQYLDAIFWADFTLLTIGIGGELVPTTHTGRSLLFPFAIGGIIMVGLVVSSVRSLVLERGKAKLSARFRENKRQKVVNSVDMDERTIRIGWFEKINFSEKGLTESQRREQEFRVMRRVQEKAERHRRYSALAISTAASMTLWLVGAVVFMKAEKPQGWSYFVSLYFAYTSLLTIGYGDFTVASNSGKAFFVFWSLLAVPTLTILISNMGDTVIKEFKDLTIWIGSLTVLPDEQGVSAAIKLALKRIQHGKLYKPRDEKDNSSDTTKDSMLDRLAEHTEDEELGEAEKAGEQGDFLQRDIHFYHYVLAKEIRQLMRDVNAQPPKQYTFQEWTYYLRLVGEDEDDSSRHRRPKNNPKHRRGKQKTPDIGAATGGEDENGEQFTWSWLGIRSPLMGNSTEAQWLLHKLTLALEEEMRKMRSPNKEVRDEKPPITMAGLKNRTSSEQTDPEKLLEKGMGSGEVRRRGRAN